jgi:hypothetical protein
MIFLKKKGYSMGKKLIILLCLLSGTHSILSESIAEAIKAVKNFKIQIDRIKSAGFAHALICKISQDFKEAADTLGDSGVTANSQTDPVEGLRNLLETAPTEANGTSTLVNDYRELTESVLKYLENQQNSENACKKAIAKAFNTTEANLFTHIQNIKEILNNPTKVNQLLSVSPVRRRPLSIPPVTPVGPQPPPVPERKVADPQALEQAIREAKQALKTTTDKKILKRTRTRLFEALKQYQAGGNITDPKLINTAQELLAKFPAPTPPLRGGLEGSLNRLTSNLQALHALVKR